MTVYVFLGPTLPRDKAAALLGARFLPPVAQGDVYRAALRDPEAIGIVDGYFEHVPAVWHKEILWALSRGIPVFGAASMGALRAAELATYGMTGVGSIFEAFARGELEDDDEVAVAHADAENDFRPLSEAMVNIRATLGAALSAEVVDPASHALLLRVAKDLHFPRRTYEGVLRAAGESGLSPQAGARLRAWLPSGRIDQKAADARSMLTAMAARPASSAGAAPSLRVEPTAVWEEARRSTVADTGGSADPSAGVAVERLLDELRLSGGFSQAVQGAALRRLALDAAPGMGIGLLPDSGDEVADFRRRHDLQSEDAFGRWLAANDLSARAFGRLMAEESVVRRVLRRLWDDVRGGLADYLRTIDRYAAPAAASRGKDRLLAATGRAHSGVADVPGGAEELLRWFSRDYLPHRPPWEPAAPPSVPRATEDPALFVRSLLRAYLCAADGPREAVTVPAGPPGSDGAGPGRPGA